MAYMPQPCPDNFPGYGAPYPSPYPAPAPYPAYNPNAAYSGGMPSMPMPQMSHYQPAMPQMPSYQPAMPQYPQMPQYPAMANPYAGGMAQYAPAMPRNAALSMCNYSPMAWPTVPQNFQQARNLNVNTQGVLPVGYYPGYRQMPNYNTGQSRAPYYYYPGAGR